jgi:hypothetical protein
VVKKENLDGIKFFLDAPTNGKGAEAVDPVSRLWHGAAAARLCGGRVAGTGEAKSWRPRRILLKWLFGSTPGASIINSTFNAAVMRYF